MEFQTPKGRVITELSLDSSADGAGAGRKIALQCAYGNSDVGITLSCSPSLRIVSQQDDKHRHNVKFVVQVLTTGVNERVGYVIVQYDAPSFGSTVHFEQTLRLKVGKVALHDNFETDLFAQLLGRSSDADVLFAYFRVLAAQNNLELPKVDWEQLNDNPLKQNTGSDPSKWNCGAALTSFAQRFAAHHQTSGGNLYYATPAPSKLSAVVFRKDVVRMGAEKIRQQLRSGNLVQVFVGHHENITVKGGTIMPSSKTHFITIFGASRDGKRFIFFDPWPGGSVLEYQSGLMGKVRSLFMGEIELDDAAGVIKSGSGRLGIHQYVILTGP